MSKVSSYTQALHEEERTGSVMNIVKPILFGGSILIGLGGVCEFNYHSEQAGYNNVKAEVLSIPADEANHRYVDAERKENEAWNYIARARKEAFWVSEKQLNSLEKLLNSNNTPGRKVGEPLD